MMPRTIAAIATYLDHLTSFNAESRSPLRQLFLANMAIMTAASPCESAQSSVRNAASIDVNVEQQYFDISYRHSVIKKLEERGFSM
jgi:hypothetical protein